MGVAVHQQVAVLDVRPVRLDVGIVLGYVGVEVARAGFHGAVHPARAGKVVGATSGVAQHAGDGDVVRRKARIVEMALELGVTRGPDGDQAVPADGNAVVEGPGLRPLDPVVLVPGLEHTPLLDGGGVRIGRAAALGDGRDGGGSGCADGSLPGSDLEGRGGGQSGREEKNDRGELHFG